MFFNEIDLSKLEGLKVDTYGADEIEISISSGASELQLYISLEQADFMQEVFNAILKAKGYSYPDSNKLDALILEAGRKARNAS